MDPTAQNYGVYPQTLHTSTATLTAAKTTYSDASNAVELVDAGEKGCAVTGLSVLSTASLTALQVLLYLSTDGGTTLRPLTAPALSASSYSTSADWQAIALPHPATGDPISPDAPLELGANIKLYAGLSAAYASGLHVTANWRGY